jgi:hypothetical protein
MKRLYSLAFSALVFLGLSAYAQQPQAPYSAWSWSGHLDHMTFDKEQAWREGIGDHATAIGFAAERYTNTSENTLSLGMSFIFYNDDDEFYQETCGYDGCGYDESEADGLTAFIEYGPKTQFGADKLSFYTVRLGATGMLYSERGIPNCSGCYDEHIDIDGGLYGVLGIGRSSGYIDWSFQFQQYFTGDIDNVLRLKISSAF